VHGRDGFENETKLRQIRREREKTMKSKQTMGKARKGEMKYKTEERKFV
jgi:hypothetical protein